MKANRCNEQINVSQVRLINFQGEHVGIVSIEQAMRALQETKLAEEEKGISLVEISPNASPPVCQIMNYNKYLYEQRKKEKDAKQKPVQVKEIKLRPVTEKNDYEVKVRKLIGFLEHGDKAKITLRFRGREMAHQEIGMQLLKKIELDLTDYGLIEQSPRLEGRQMVMVIGPKKKEKSLK